MKFRWPFISQKRDQEMTDEMAFHIEAKTRELVDAGMSEVDARFEARRRIRQRAETERSRPRDSGRPVF